MKKIFFDTETTGLTPGQIAQLAMIIEEDGKVRALNYYFSIDYITPDAEKLCGRGVEFYKQASQGKKFADYNDEIYNEMIKGTLIAHNLKFDENFISTEFWRLNKLFKPEARFDTMTYFKDICKIPKPSNPSLIKNPKLIELCNYFSVDANKVMEYTKKLFGKYADESQGFHDAMYDTTSMFVAFQVYREQIDNSGVCDWKNAFTK